MAVLKEKAPAKVNFALDIVGKREDGYHEMCMINHTVLLTDDLTFLPGQDIQLTCDNEQVPLGEENLIYRAAVKLRQQYSIAEGAVIHLEKHIPVQAGLGGGSSDAAAAIRGLNRLWQLDLSEETMRDFGAGIGADVPYCISGKTALVQGFGEQVTFLKDMPELPVLIVKPAIDISTPKAFNMADSWKGITHPDVVKTAEYLNNGDWESAVKTAGNSFETPVFKRWPFIKMIKEKCLEQGALYAAMSGSGSTIVAYFCEKCMAEQAAEMIRSKYTQTIVSTVWNSR